MPCCSGDDATAPTPLLGEPGRWSDWSAHPVLEHYAPESVLGTGAFSKVHRGRCRASGDIVAIKVVYRLNPGVKPGQWPVLRNEATMLAKVDHPNIVKLQEHFEDDRQFVMVLEMLKGGQVLEQLKAIEKYSEKAAAHLFREMLHAVAHMHERGIIHRDIKPENIILQSLPPATANGSEEADEVSIKLIDLGIACDLTAAGTDPPTGAVGTTGFVAPEVCIGLPHTPAMDMWSMGIMLYVMLCGQLPYTDTQMETMSYVNTPFRMSPGYADENFANLSFWAREMILKMLTHNPERRATAMQLLRHSWLTQADAPSIPLPQAPAGAQRVAAYRSQKGMANCVVASAGTDSLGGGSSAASDSNEPLARAVLLADMDDETKISGRELAFDPRVFLDNFHDGGSRGLHGSDPAGGGSFWRRRRGSQGSATTPTALAPQPRWSDNLLNGLSARSIGSLMGLKQGPSFRRDRAWMHVVDEDASMHGPSMTMPSVMSRDEQRSVSVGGVGSGEKGGAEHRAGGAPAIRVNLRKTISCKK